MIILDVTLYSSGFAVDCLSIDRFNNLLFLRINLFEIKFNRMLSDLEQSEILHAEQQTQTVERNHQEIVRASLEKH